MTTLPEASQVDLVTLNVSIIEYKQALQKLGQFIGFLKTFVIHVLSLFTMCPILSFYVF